MKFTDEDLKRLKDELDSTRDGPLKTGMFGFHREQIEALLRRLECAEAISFIVRYSQILRTEMKPELEAWLQSKGETTK